MKIKLLTIILIASFQFLPAQDAKKILDNTSAVYSAGAGYVLSFTLNINDVPAKTTYTHDGKAYVKGNKFKLEVPDGTTWFDGKTQWLYLDGSDEVNVSNPTGEELLSISPIAMLNMYKSGFKLVYKGEIKENNKPLYLIEMIPLKKGSEITKFILKIDKQTNLITEAELKGKDKVNNQLVIKRTEKSTGLADAFFVFNKKDYPNVEVIDLR